MQNNRSTLLEWLSAGALDEQSASQALQALGGERSRASWLTFAQRALLLCGLLALAIGVVFLIAFNWDALHRMTKFAMAALVLVAAVVAHAVLPRTHAVSLSLLPAIILLIGSLLALNGQVYQTGADLWQLFTTWALIAIPIAVATRSLAVWLMALGIANFALLFYLDIYAAPWGWLWSSDVLTLWLLAAGNLAVATAFELFPWLVNGTRSQRTIVRLAIGLGGSCLTILAGIAVDTLRQESMLGFVAWTLMIALLYFIYRIRRIDVLLMAATALSVSIIIVSIAIEVAFDSSFDADAFSLLVISGLVIALATVAGRWLQSLTRESRNND